MVNINLEGKAIYRVAFFRDCVEIRTGGGIITITDEKEIETLRQWEKEARAFAKTRDEVTTYIEYMIDFGQYAEGR